MPSYVIVKSAYQLGETAEAILCDAASITGFPDRRTDVPVQVRLVSGQALCVDDEPRRIISSVSESGSTTFLVDGTTKGIRNRERRQRLAQALALLQQFAATLKPLAAGSEELQALQTLF